MGDVGPFGIINDSNHVVEILIGKELVDAENINLSANSLTTTVAIDYNELIRFIKLFDNDVIIID